MKDLLFAIWVIGVGFTFGLVFSNAKTDGQEILPTQTFFIVTLWPVALGIYADQEIFNNGENE